MSEDIRIQNNNNKFKFRVAGIVENDGKYLIVKMNQNPFFCFAGGHVELFENTKDALERELKEELYFDIEVGDLVAINENFYKLRGDNCHELCFYYFVKPKNKCIDMQDLTLEEEDKYGKVIHRFKWVSKNELLSLDVKPKEIVNYIVENNALKHFIINN